MATARSRTSFDVEKLTLLIHGNGNNPDLVSSRRAAWSRVESVLGTSDTTILPAHYAKTSREALYEDGLRLGKAAWDDQLDHGDHGFFEWLTPRYTLCNYSPFGLSATLFARTVHLMGTEAQRGRWGGAVARGEINGTYAQTELGHGSFVRGLETTATFDSARDEFVLRSPTVTSTKFWPGGLGFSTTHAVVMAQLVIGGVRYGVHAFVVRLREAGTGRAAEGVELGDVGMKMSYNQTDNGYARFDGVRVPRGDMLMGHAEVSRDGGYARREGVHPKAVYGGMLVGRAKLVFVCAVQLAAAVTIAVRYSTVRQQGYGDPELLTEGETAIFGYRSQHHRLLVHLSRAYAVLFASRRSERRYEDLERRQGNGDFSATTDTHILLSGIKAWATATAADGAEDARKCCGGAGYLAISGLPEIVQSSTVLCTLEGENYVLWQQVARYLVKWAPRLLGNTVIPDGSLSGVPEDLQYLADPPVPGTTQHASKGIVDFAKPEIQFRIFQHRARYLLWKANKLLSQPKDTTTTTTPNQTPPTDPWNQNVMLLIATARAHVEYLVLRSFHDAVSKTTNSLSAKEREILSNLQSLFALSTITDSPHASTFSNPDL